MPDYQKGKIYTIRNKKDTNLIYVGSTCDVYLSNRIGKHRANSKTNPNNHFYKIIEDWNDWYIELYENYPCNSKNELTKREGEIIREIGTLNMKRAGLNLPPIINGDTKEYDKEFRKLPEQVAKKKDLEKSKVKCPLCDLEVTRYKLKRHQASINCKNIVRIELDNENKEKQRIKNNEYYNRRYYEKKEEILQKQKDKRSEKITCECCGIFSKNLLKRHIKTLTHQEWEKKNML